MNCYFHWVDAHSDFLQMNVLGGKDGRVVFHCSECGLIHSPQPSLDDYRKVYTDPKRYWDMSVSVGYSSFEGRFQHDYEVNEVRVLNLVEVVGRDVTSILDVGCGNSALVKRLVAFGFKAFGVDLDEWTLRRAAKLVSNLQCYRGDFMTVGIGRKFDVIAFTDSFEHFLDPRRCVHRARSLLNDKGLVVVETPDVGCDDWKNQGLGWRHVKPIEHPFLFKKWHVEELFKEVGMRIISTRYTIPGRAVYYLR